jgi:hypothetical protein
MKGLLLLLALVCGASPLYAQALEAADRNTVVSQSAILLKERYVDPKLGAALARELPGAARAWSKITDPAAFAAAMTAWLRTRSQDGHLGLSYSATPIREGGDDSFSESEMQRYYGAQVNHGIQKIERLDGNIMLLELSVFPPTSMAADVFAAAMNVVAQGDALIIDLRRNGGGAETANLLTGYLLEPGDNPLSGYYDRPSNKTQASTAPIWVPGRRFGGKKPLYILTSKRTFSAAEAVAYDLQALRRAVIVGERTGGGAHPFAYRRVHPHFALDLPEGRSVNPITGGNWQGVGVKPDVEIEASEALARALALAKAATEKTPTTVSSSAD